jgi:hypothetical protein
MIYWYTYHAYIKQLIGGAMASRVIHYLIAERIAESNKQIDRDRFVYGALLPDLSLHEDGSYDMAHFGEKLIELKIKGINWEKFRNKYSYQMSCDSLYEGYYCHLIMDALWFSKIVDKYIRIHPHPERKVYYQKSYEDYKTLNYLLTKEYDLHYYLPIINKVEIEEINLLLRDDYFESLYHDMNQSLNVDKKDLHFYSYDLINDYIKQAKELCIKELIAFNNRKESMNPIELYTKE